MHGLLKQPGYRLYPPDSPEAGALLAEQGLGPADLDRALAGLEAHRGHRGPHHRRDQRGRRVRHQPRRAGARTCPTPATSPSSRCSGSRSTSCSAACPRAARRGSSRTARCRAKPRAAPPSTGWPAEASIRSTDRSATLRRRGLAPGGDLSSPARQQRRPCSPAREHAILAIDLRRRARSVGVEDLTRRADHGDEQCWLSSCRAW